MPTDVARDKLKQDLIAMRTLPRAMLLREIKARNCIHHAEFCLSDQKCWGCDLGRECLEIVGLSRSYILSKLGGATHERIGCRCASCNWLRELEIIFTQNKLTTKAES